MATLKELKGAVEDTVDNLWEVPPVVVLLETATADEDKTPLCGSWGEAAQ